MAIGNPISLTDNVASRLVSATATAGQTSFTVSGGYRINAISVYRNGVKLSDNEDFTASDGSTVNLVNAATLGDTLAFEIFDDFRVADAIVSAASSQTIQGDLAVNGTLYFNNSDLNNLNNINASGVITASSFVGDGAGLTGVASTDNIITGTAATFTGGINANSINVSGDVSIGGTLTYEDVTNIDSVGLITARSGVEITGGELTLVGTAFTVGQAGVVTATSFIGDGSSLTGVESWNQFDTWLYGGG